MLSCKNSDYSVETSVVSQRNSFEIGCLQKVTTTSEKMSYFQSLGGGGGGGGGAFFTVLPKVTQMGSRIGHRIDCHG